MAAATERTITGQEGGIAAETVNPRFDKLGPLSGIYSGPPIRFHCRYRDCKIEHPHGPDHAAGHLPGRMGRGKEQKTTAAQQRDILPDSRKYRHRRQHTLRQEHPARLFAPAEPVGPDAGRTHRHLFGEIDTVEYGQHRESDRKENTHNSTLSEKIDENNRPSGTPLCAGRVEISAPPAGPRTLRKETYSSSGMRKMEKRTLP